MDMITSGRFRLVSLVLLILLLWQSHLIHPDTLRASGMRAVLMVAFAFIGTRLSWRWLRFLGLPLALAGAWWVQYPDGADHWTGLIDLTLALAVVLLMGRLAQENRERRAAQARALADLQKAHRALQAHAAQVEELSALRERSRLARELHDTLGHSLSAITVQLEAARRLQRHDPAAVEPLLVETQGLARQGMTELRQYLTGLRNDPAGSDLPTRLEELAREAADRNRWQLGLELAPMVLSTPVHQALLQIGREGLTNIERHAGARRVAVSLWLEQGQVLLRITDDGRGFNPNRHPTGHFGLQGMRERVAELGGQLQVESNPGLGSTVTARIPVASKERPAK